MLLSNAEFLSYNARQHNRFRAAIQKFLGFIGSDLTWTAPAKDDSEPAETYRDEGYEEVLRQSLIIQANAQRQRKDTD